jgi:hypothetical protein
MEEGQRLCAYGCGGTPKTAKAVTILGHHKRIADWKERFGRDDQRERRCAIPMCRRPIKDKPSHIRIYCSRACAAIARQGHLSPKTPLGRFLFNQWRASGQTLSEWSRGVGIHRETLKELMQDALPIQRTYDRLKAAFGSQVPETPTETERRRDTILKYQGNPHTPEAVAKSAASRRGKSQTPERIAKRDATMRASGGHERRVAALLTNNTSLSKRALTGLPMRLRSLDGLPTPEDLGRWAKGTGAALGIPPDAVLAIWKPYLQKRGLLSPGGRPPKLKRCQIIADELARIPVGRRHRVPNGFWPNVAQLITDAEGEPIDAMSVKAWRVRHKIHPNCPLATLDLLSVTKPSPAIKSR